MNRKLGWGFLGGAAGRYQNCALYLWDTFYTFVSCTLEHLPKEVCFENKYPAPKINECLLRDDRWMFLGFKTWQQILSESQPHVQRVECRMVQKILTTTDWGKLGPRSPQNIQANEFAVVECGEQTNAGAPNDDSITSSLDTTYYIARSNESKHAARKFHFTHAQPELSEFGFGICEISGVGYPGGGFCTLTNVCYIAV